MRYVGMYAFCGPRPLGGATTPLPGVPPFSEGVGTMAGTALSTFAARMPSAFAAAVALLVGTSAMTYPNLSFWSVTVAPYLASWLTTPAALPGCVAMSSGTVAWPFTLAAATSSRSPFPRPLPWLPGFAKAPAAARALTATTASASTASASARADGLRRSFIKFVLLSPFCTARHTRTEPSSVAQSSRDFPNRQGASDHEEGRVSAARFKPKSPARRLLRGVEVVVLEVALDLPQEPLQVPRDLAGAAALREVAHEVRDVRRAEAG